MRHAFAKSLLLLVITALVTAAVVLVPTLADRGTTTELFVAAPPTASPPAQAPVTFEPTPTPTAVATTEPVGVPVRQPAAAAPDLEIPLPTATATPDNAADDGSDEPETAIDASSLDAAEPTATPTPAPTEEPTAAPEPTATPIPSPTAAPEPTATPTPEPTATPLPQPTPTSPPVPTATPEPTATPSPEPTATPLPTATATPVPVTSVESAWLFVNSIDGLLLRAEPGGAVLRALAHRDQVFATGSIIEWGGRQWMQIESPTRGWAAREFLTSEPPDEPVTATPEPSGEPPSPADWQALRQCESGGRYDIVSSNGLYHGAYQFLPSTWDTIAGRAGRPDLIGVLPSQASPADQDAMAQFLYSLQGSSPWPHCGQALL